MAFRTFRRINTTRLDGVVIYDPPPKPSFCEPRFNEFDTVESDQSRRYTQARNAERKWANWLLSQPTKRKRKRN